MKNRKSYVLAMKISDGKFARMSLEDLARYLGYGPADRGRFKGIIDAAKYLTDKKNFPNLGAPIKLVRYAKTVQYRMEQDRLRQSEIKGGL